MTLPVIVRGALYQSGNSAATTRAETYISPYIRAGWENWKLSLAEAQAAAESEDSAYKSRLAYYKMLTEAKSELQSQLARLQETSYKNGADVDKENFSAETKFAIEEADAANQARRTGAEEAGKNNRAEQQGRIDLYRSQLGLLGAKAQADATREASPSAVSKNADAIRGQVVAGYVPTGTFDPNDPTALREAVLDFKKKALARGDQIEDVRKGMDALVRSLEAVTPEVVKNKAFDNLFADQVLSSDLEKGATGNRKGPGGEPPATPGTNIPNTGYTAVGIERPEALVAKPADTSDLEAKLAALDAKLKAIDVSAPERKSLIEEARANYAKNFRGFPGAIKTPEPAPVVDRLYTTKVEAAKKTKQLFDAYNLDITDPVNAKEKDRVFQAYDPAMVDEINKLVEMSTYKTEPGVIEKQIQAKYEGAGKLSDAMAYYLFKKKTTRPTPPPPPPKEPTVTVNPPPVTTPTRTPGSIEAM